MKYSSGILLNRKSTKQIYIHWTARYSDTIAEFTLSAVGTFFFTRSSGTLANDGKYEGNF